MLLPSDSRDPSQKGSDDFVTTKIYDCRRCGNYMLICCHLFCSVSPYPNSENIPTTPPPAPVLHFLKQNCSLLHMQICVVTLPAVFLVLGRGDVLFRIGVLS